MRLLPRRERARRLERTGSDAVGAGPDRRRREAARRVRPRRTARSRHAGVRADRRTGVGPRDVSPRRHSCQHQPPRLPDSRHPRRRREGRRGVLQRRRPLRDVPLAAGRSARRRREVRSTDAPEPDGAAARHRHATGNAGTASARGPQRRQGHSHGARRRTGHGRDRAPHRLRRRPLRPGVRADAVVAPERRHADSRGHRSTAGARRSAGEVDRRRHAQRHRLPGEPEMMLKTAGLLLAIAAASQAVPPLLDPSLMTKPPIDAWPTYHGDYSGRRYSTLKQITTGNVKNLTLAWVYRLNTSRAGAIVGGEGPDTAPAGLAAPTIKSTPLMLHGVLYFSAPDHVWAIDARTGRENWRFAWKTRGGDHIGNRGVGLFGDWLYFLTPDNYFVSLDARTGRERWHREIANMKREYFSSNAPIVIGRNVIVGVGGDALDIPGYLESRDPENGEMVWRWNTTPRPGDPGADTWPDEYAMSSGGGMPWLPGTYDPDLNLYYIGTGNPQPVLTGQTRPGDNLYTCSIVAIRPDTGRMAWYYQVTPHDTHDWDAAQTPVLIDGVINGQPRKLVAQASRNGHFVLLDRTNGTHILTTRLIDSANWTKAINAKGQPIGDRAKDATVAGTLVSPDTNGATNWPPPSFGPDTGLF